MTDDFRSSPAYRALREKAERLIAGRPARSAPSDETDLLRLIHEVEVQHAELEVQHNELQQAMKALEASRHAYADLYHSSPIAIVTLNHRFIVDAFNQAAGRLFNQFKGVASGSPFVAFVAGDDQSRFFDYLGKIAAGQSPDACALRLATSRHRSVHVRLHARIKRGKENATVQWHFFVVDVTRQRRAEARLRQAQKMEAVGTLAGGIAHHFNNILTPLMGFADMLCDDLPADSPLREDAREILRAAVRLQALVEQMLAFSRASDDGIQPLELPALVGNTLRFLRDALPAAIDLVEEIDGRCGPVAADPDQIRQVLMNLMTNARDALQPGGGTIRVTVREASIDGADRNPPHLSPGRYACLTVADTGSGIAENHLARIFDPYFTTKAVGAGIGLGLSSALGIVQKHGGDIRVHSTPGRGTKMHVYLPLAAPDAGAPGSGRSDAPAAGGERILLAVDEASALKVMKMMLERFGYTVDDHCRSPDALAALADDPAGFDLIITDLAMPELSGDRLARQAKSIRAGISVVALTGYGKRLSGQEARSMGFDAVIGKPVGKQQLATLVRNLLDGGAERS